MKMTPLIVGVVVVAVLAGVAVYVTNARPAGPHRLDAFAQCLKESGAKFYGAFWCPHCQNQKKLFGSAEQYLPYVECSTPNGQAQLAVCKEAGVESYPTWVFPDGSREVGEVPLARLAEKTSCTLPE